MSYSHQQDNVQSLAEWRRKLAQAGQSLDQAQASLGMLCKRINLADESDDLSEVAAGIATLLRQCQEIAVEIDEITTFERAHALISMMQGVLIFIDLRVQGA